MYYVGRRNWKDSPKHWTKNFTKPPDFDAKSYQEFLNKIAGFSREKPILLLEWGGNTTIRRYSEWDSSGRPTKLVEEPKYKLRRVNPITKEFELIPMRRWIIAQRQEPEQYGYGDDRDTTFEDSDGVTKKAAEKPKGGLYTPLIYVGDHSSCPKDCCANMLCVGDYKHPDIAELKWIAEKTHLLKTEMFASPYAMLGPAELARIKREEEAKKIPLSKKIEDIAKGL